MVLVHKGVGRQGRLGNALFQIAGTIGLARQNGMEPLFPSDWIHRPYFSVPDEMFGPLPDDYVEAPSLAAHLDPRCQAYLQDINLFSDGAIKEEIVSYFQPSELAVEQLHNEWAILKELPEPVLGVHVRRGDNVVDPGIPNKSDYHHCPNLGYYIEAIKRHRLKYESVAVFSDDAEWCKEALPADYYGGGIAHPKEHESDYWTVTPKDWIDFFMLATCSRFVVTGSTFGIWAAIISGVPATHVVRPVKVYGPMLSYIDSELLFDPEWQVQPCC